MFFFQLFSNRTLSTCQCNWFLMIGEKKKNEPRKNFLFFLLFFQSSKCMKRIVCDDWLQILYLVTIDLFSFFLFLLPVIPCLSMTEVINSVCVCEMKYKENKSQAIIFLSTMKCEERLVDMRRMHFFDNKLDFSLFNCNALYSTRLGFFWNFFLNAIKIVWKMPVIHVICDDFKYDERERDRWNIENLCFFFSRWFYRQQLVLNHHYWLFRKICLFTIIQNMDDEHDEQILSTEVRPSQTPIWVSFSLLIFAKALNPLMRRYGSDSPLSLVVFFNLHEN
jgi:hypothetical protein